MVRFVDETLGGARDDAWALEIFEERLTLREPIRRRVHQEVAEHNARLSARLARGRLVEPDGRYLCIVPGRGAGVDPQGVSLPFEGDRTLSPILSKALLLADDDDAITDLTIVGQLGR
ncbi:hypothetical protein [Frankia sp. QA3]|uniref:DUF7737 domain-containing protein n=1 Tax=Frankia sp. QA3 TaxID=710111 RepID=UPI0012FC2370|nr:hypothetical protein [Frankia sp. QA3]